MGTVSLPAARIAVPRSKRLLALASDERLVERIRGGDELAFEVAFERHSAALLSFCRHMLRSPEEAEDALQHTFASAYTAIRRDDREVRLKPWLFAIARNRCVSMLRARREQPDHDHEIPTAGLAEQVEHRDELRDLLGDLDDLPDDQREALLLAEVSGLAHTEVAEVIGCKPHRVKALVFRARSGLIERREARETACSEIREQLANLTGGSLRRSGIAHHLRVCEGCREYRAQVKLQRRMLAAVLPVIPTPGLKESVLAAIGLGGGAASGGAGLTKLAVVGMLAAGGAAAGDAVVKHPDNVPSARDAERAPAPERARATSPIAVVTPAAKVSAAALERYAPEPTLMPKPAPHHKRGATRRSRTARPAAADPAAAGHRQPHVPPGQAKRNADKPIPPGQAKTNADKPIPPGQAKTMSKPASPDQTKNLEPKPVPPGQAKKLEAAPKPIPPGEAKKAHQPAR